MKINIDEIILKHCTTKTNDYGTHFSSINEWQCKQAMKEFAEKVLELAAKNAKLINRAAWDLPKRMEIDEDSITNTINQIEF